MAASHEQRHIIENLLQELPGDLQRIVRARYWENQSQEAIAQECGLSQRQVSRLLERARALLRSHLALKGVHSASAL
jgi:RNA polymerase sigma factor (sigma-70 family)